MPWFESIADLETQASAIRVRRYGVIDAESGEFRRVRLRPWPKIASVVEGKLWGEWLHGRVRGDRCSLYYNQPHRFSNFLAAAYAWSTRDCSLRTIRAALATLDEIARIKGTDAILCDVIGSDISDRLLARWGWESHAPSLFHRNYIKRFYGAYPNRRGADVEERELASC
ncbi:MAG: hypothetical protein DCC68_20585 [Planctomycetota bacterium]|nr:MAG: hypothetical protein DCC68_20585 [Planctomycetota bacterium]